MQWTVKTVTTIYRPMEWTGYFHILSQNEQARYWRSHLDPDLRPRLEYANDEQLSLTVPFAAAFVINRPASYLTVRTQISEFNCIQFLHRRLVPLHVLGETATANSSCQRVGSLYNCAVSPVCTVSHSAGWTVTIRLWVMNFERSTRKPS
jgi:hypothetical protein